MNEVHKYYDALHQYIQTDMISVDEDFRKYDVVIAPVMYMAKQGFAERVEAFVSQGGTFVTTFFSGIVNENDLVTLGGYPGERKVMGVWAEEIDARFRASRIRWCARPEGTTGGHLRLRHSMRRDPC